VPVNTSTAADAADIVARVEALAVDAASWVARAVAGREHPPISSEQARKRFQGYQDQLYHIRLLVGALATGENRFFTDYVRWLATTLSSRGIALDTIEASLRLLLSFYVQRLDSAARTAVATLLAEGLAALANPGDAEDFAQGRLMPPPLPETEALTEALTRGDRAAACKLALAAADPVDDYVELAVRLFQPALYRIGFLWQRNMISVAQEHLATETARSILGQLFALKAFRLAPIGRKALFAAVEQDQHVLGLQMVAQAFEIAGWTVQYIGANTPSAAVLAQVELWKPELVGLSASLVQQLPQLRRTVDSLRGEFGALRPTILVGGRATNEFDSAWLWTGADAWSPDARAAVAQMA
jgi:methanogenic corrinoid protein MtbC1